MVLLGASILIPLAPLASAAVPLVFVPIQFPAITFPVLPAPSTRIPFCEFPEIKFPYSGITLGFAVEAVSEALS